jgi:mannose-6-phosphate isomerase-like protein (cupin superfamily)
MEENIQKVMGSISSLINLQLSDLQSFRFLHSFDVGEEFLVGKAIKSVVLEKDETSIKFKTTIPEGDGTPMHWHDGPEEIHVLKGSMGCKMTEQIFTEGHTCVVPKLREHSPYNAGKGDLELITILTKD